MKDRKSNFELLRIILMCTIPIYHLMVYNGVYYVNNANGILALIFTVGGAISADYAFVALSSYFMLERKEENKTMAKKGIRGFLSQPVIKRFLYLVAQVLTLYIVKVVVLRLLFGYNNTEYFVDFFLMKGAWWYIYPYMVLSLIYPILNRFIARLKDNMLGVVTVVLGVIFVLNGVRNNGSFLQDMEAFIFVYFLMAVLKRWDYKYYFGLPTKRKIMGSFAATCYGLMLFATIYVKKIAMSYVALNGAVENGDFATQGIKQTISDIQDVAITNVTSQGMTNFVIGRYHLLSLLMGIAIFFVFKDIDIGIKPVINKISKTTMYVFLLHDTWMGVFWYFGKCWNDFGEYSTPEFLLWMMIYLVSSFVMAGLCCVIYEKCIKRIWSVLIDKLLVVK